MQNMKTTRTKRTTTTTTRIAVLIAAVLVLAAAAYAGHTFLGLHKGSQHSEQVMETMKTLIPGLGVETGISTGQGRDPLPALSIDGVDIVGCIEIPSLELMAPVAASGYEEEGFAAIVSGSPVKGKLRIKGGRGDVFREIAKAAPGDTVTFTDIDGVRYNYRVTTQFHLKDWDEADNDLMLCYESDEDTDFVLGCTAE